MTDQSNWYMSFFSGLAVEMWHRAAAHINTKQETDFITANLNATDKYILDVPCGTGRHTLALAYLGYNVTSMDISADSIDVLNTHRQKNVTSICTDILQYPLTGTYDAAICMGNSFSYFAYNDMVAFSRKIKQALKPGGRFIINSGAIAEDILPNLKPRLDMQLGDLQFTGVNTYIPESKLLETKMTFEQDGIIEHKTAYHFIYIVSEVKQILREAGFINLNLYSSATMAPYQSGSGQLYVVAS